MALRQFGVANEIISLAFGLILGALAVAAVVGVCLRWRVAGTWTALALFGLPTLPTLLDSLHRLSDTNLRLAVIVAHTHEELADPAEAWARARRMTSMLTNIAKICGIKTAAGTDPL